MKTTLALLALVFVAGCATTQSISDAQRKSIRSVTVANKVVVPESPQVVGPSANKAGFWLGPLAMVAVMHSENDDAVKLKSYLKEQKIDIGQIVRQEFVTNLTATQAFPAIVAEGGEATIDLVVESYGFAPGFSMRPINKPVRPTLRLIAKLSTSDGKVLWQHTGYTTNLSGEFEPYQLDEYYGTPGRVQEAFTKAAQLVVKELLSDLSPAQPR
jgi:hypothetical protein